MQFWSDNYRNLILAQDLQFITQSNVKKFELKTAYTKGVIYCKRFCQFLILGPKKGNHFFVLKKISFNPISLNKRNHEKSFLQNLFNHCVKTLEFLLDLLHISITTVAPEIIYVLYWHHGSIYRYNISLWYNYSS